MPNVDISYADITNEQLEQFVNLRTLTDYDRLFHTATSYGIRNLTSLEEIWCDFGFADLADMGNLTNLRKLNINDGIATDLGVLPRLTKLEFLALSTMNELGPGIITQASQLPILKEFRYASHSFENLYADEIALLTHVPKLDISNFNMTDETLIALSTSTVLTDLDISNCILITDKGVEALGQIPTLRTLSLNANNLTSACIVHLTGLTSLELKGTTTFDIVHLSQLSNLMSLKMNGVKAKLGNCSVTL